MIAGSRIGLAFALLLPAASPSLAEELPLRVSFPRSCLKEDGAIDPQRALGVFAARISGENSSGSEMGKVMEEEHELVKSIEAGRTDLFAMTPDVYLASVTDLDIMPILITVTDRSPTERLLLLAKSGDLSELKGSNLIIDTSGRGRTPANWISDFLRSVGQSDSAETYFESVEEVNTAARAMLPVYFDKKDAAIISEDSFEALCALNREIRDELHVVSRSKQVASTLVCVRRGSGHRISDLVMAGESLHKDKRGKQLLRLMGAAKLVAFKDEYLLYDRLIHNRAASAKRKSRNREGGGS